MSKGLDDEKNKSEGFKNISNNIALEINKLDNTEDNKDKIKSLKSQITSNNPNKFYYDEGTKIPNKILEILCYTDLSLKEYKILLYIIRMTIGGKKCSTYYKPKEIIEKTNLKKRSLLRGLSELEDKNIIKREDSTIEDKNNKIFTKKKITLNLCLDRWLCHIPTHLINDIDESEINDNNGNGYDDDKSNDYMDESEIDELLEDL